MTFDGSPLAFSDSDNSVWRWDGNAPKPLPVESAKPASALLPSPWLEELWDQARSSAREAVWNGLPDRIGDFVEQGKPLAAGDIAFLRARSADRSGTLTAAVAALCTLGRLCEDEPGWRSEAAPAFALALQEQVAGLRYAAVEAIWQARVVAAIPALDAALQLEPDETVRATIEHVLRILR